MTLIFETLDMMQYLVYGGFNWTPIEVEGPNGGETQSGKTIRDIVARKGEMSLTLRPLSAQELAAILTLLERDSLRVTYTHRSTGAVVTREMFCTELPNPRCISRGGADWYTGVSFTMREVHGNA